MTQATRRSLLIAASGLLAMGFFLEGNLASLHGVTMATVDEHADVSWVPHLFASLCIGLSQWPLATDAWSPASWQRRLWSLVAIAVVSAVTIAKGMIVASVLAFAIAVGTFVSHWARSRDDTKRNS